jgi:excinuclease ABC subunit A
VFEVLAAARGQKQTSSNIVIGLEQFDQIVTIEQAAITRMKRSNVATYSEVYTEIRKTFGGSKEARDKGLSAKHFSFNTPGGRCEHCEGLGYVTSNMLFFTNIEVTCPVCGGKQFNDEVLSVRYNGYTIKEILQMSVEEALVAFNTYPKIKRVLALLQDVGLGYLELGQTLTTLSGGEGQRLKLAKELINNTGKHSLYLMDEPTAGLHPVDVENFLTLLNRMVDSGSTVIVVEHNQQIIRASDWIIDLGPEGGKNGGQVVFEGTPWDIGSSKSTTAKYMM